MPILCTVFVREVDMRKFVWLGLLFSVTILFAGPISVDFGSMPEKELTPIKKIPYGTGADQVGIFIPVRNEEKPFGVNALSGDGKKLLILDNMNKRVLSFDLHSKTLKKELSLPSETFNALSVKGMDLFLHNNKEERLYVKSDDTVKPLTKPVTEKTTVYPYTKFLGNGAVRVVLSEKNFFELRFTDRPLMSFLLVGKADDGDLFFQIELGDGSRHILITSGTGTVLGRMSLIESTLYKPEQDIYVSGDGTVYFISPGHDALVIYGGRL